MKNNNLTKKEQVIKALKAVENNVSARVYFYNKISSKWLNDLVAEGVYKDLPGISYRGDYIDFNPWAEGAYLMRVSEDKPNEVNDVLLKLDTLSTDNADVLKMYIDVLLMIVKKSSQVVIDPHINKIINEKWIDKKYVGLLPYRIVDLIEYLISVNRVDLINLFAKELAVLKISSRKGITTDDVYRDIATVFPVHQFQDFTEKLASITSKDSTNIKDLLKILLNCLVEGIKLKQQIDNNDPNDLIDRSYIWRAAIEDNSEDRREDVLDLVINVIRDVFVNNISVLTKADIVEVLSDLPKYSLIRRFEYFVYSLKYEEFASEIEGFMRNDFNDYEVWYEYQQVLKKFYKSFNLKLRKFYLESIKNIPLLEESTLENPERYNIYRQARLIAPIKDLLSKVEQQKFKEVLKYDLGMPSDRFFIMRGGSVSDKSPIKQEILSEKSVEDVIDILKDFKSKHKDFDDNEPSYEGLADSFGLDIRQRPSEYFEKIELFLNKGIRPLYLSRMFWALRENIVHLKTMKWDIVLSFSKSLITLYEENNLPDFEPLRRSVYSGVDNEWKEAIKALISFVEDLIKFHSIPAKLEDQKNVLELIKLTLKAYDKHDHPDYSDEMDLFSLTINDTKGETLHLLFNFMIRIKKKDPIANEVMNYINELIEIETAPLANSVYGQYLPWIYDKSVDVFNKLVDKALPIDNPEVRYVAWESYLTNQMYHTTFKSLKEHYKKAIEEINNIPKRRYWAEPDERLAEHILIAHLYKIDGHEELFPLLMDKLSLKLREHLVDVVGRHYIEISNDFTPPTEESLKSYWEYVIKNYKYSDELQSFGWWVMKDRFDNDWMLDRLLETLEITDGKIEPDFRVLESFEELISDYPEKTLKAVKFIVDSKSNQNKHFILGDESIMKILQVGKTIKKTNIQKLILDIVNILLDMGEEKYRVITDS